MQMIDVISHGARKSRTRLEEKDTYLNITYQHRNCMVHRGFV